MRHRSRQTRGQVFVEFAIVLPVLVVLLLIMLELGSVFLQQQAISTVAREGANLISRQTTLADAELALSSMASGLPFGSDATVILSVVQLGAGGRNGGEPIIAHRRMFGAVPESSTFGNPPAGAYGGPPAYAARDAANDVSIRVTGNLRTSLTGDDVLFLTEVYVRHQPLTPLGGFGLPVPSTLSAVAYF